MNTILIALQGRKTYIFAALGVLTVIAQALHYITPNVMVTLLTLEGFGSIAALRAAISGLTNPALSQTIIDGTPSGASYAQK